MYLLKLKTPIEERLDEMVRVFYSLTNVIGSNIALGMQEKKLKALPQQ